MWKSLNCFESTKRKREGCWDTACIKTLRTYKEPEVRTPLDIREESKETPSRAKQAGNQEDTGWLEALGETGQESTEREEEPGLKARPVAEKINLPKMSSNISASLVLRTSSIWVSQSWLLLKNTGGINHTSLHFSCLWLQYYRSHHS